MQYHISQSINITYHKVCDSCYLELLASFMSVMLYQRGRQPMACGPNMATPAISTRNQIMQYTEVTLIILAEKNLKIKGI